MSHSLEVDPDGRFYQDGRPVRGRDLDPTLPFFLVPGGDAATDQGDAPDACAACAAGEHDECLDIAAEPGLHTCGCIDGACRGEWVDVGYTTPEEVVRIDAASLALVQAAVVGPLARPVRDRAGILDRASIDQSRPVPRPGYVQLSEAVGGLPDDAPERARVLANRSDRRRARRRG